jgi:hypothetical protein
MAPGATSGTVVVTDRGMPIGFSFEDLIKHHGPGSPGGVAHTLKVMERAFPLLTDDARPERREITVATAHGGPGVRDAFELVTRAVTEGRYAVDPALARPERGRTLERFAFQLGHRGRAVTLLVREGFVPDELIALAGLERRNAAQTARLDVLKREMADRVLARPPADVYDVVA